ncbi:MAG: hypothetical protein R6W71_05050, partial [Bacteroidales bacterium]
MKQLLMQIIRPFLVIFAFLISAPSFSQGCNDAGICTFGDFGTIHIHQKQKIKAEVSYIFGLGEQQSLVNTIQLDQRFSVLKDRGQIFFRLPFTYIYGNLGHTAGLGDVTAGMEYNVFRKEELNITVMAGGKIPSNDANKSIEGKGLPMVYQTSLGTYDLILGAGAIIATWRIGLAYQKPFGTNENTFLHESWPDNDEAREYFESNQLKRGDDMMLRLDKSFSAGKKNKLDAGLLAVYRLQKDQITRDGETVSLDESDGITINASLSYTFSMEDKGNLRLLLAAPIITRKYRADGLTRTFVFSLTYAL